MQQHVNQTCRNCHYYLRQIGRIRPYLTEFACKNAIQSLVISRLDGCNAILNGISVSQLNRLQVIQNKAARVIARINPREHITPVLRELHWLPVRSRIAYKTVMYVFKCLRGFGPAYMRDLLQLYERPRGMRTLQRGPILKVPRVKSSFGERSFMYAAAKTWNSLPVEVREADSLPTFKRLLKTCYFRLEFY